MSLSVRARGLKKAYVDGARRLEVLRGVDLEVAPGEFMAVEGPSGSGKSTLLHLLGALDRPDEGSIEMAPIKVSPMPPRPPIRFVPPITTMAMAVSS